MGKYFKISEFTRSDTAVKYGIDNTPSLQAVQNINNLIDKVLDPLREAYGKPIRVTSGYRSKTLNKKVGGVRNSEHLCNGTSAAADITGGSPEENRKLWRLVLDLKLPFRQMINEKGYSWVHISYNPYDVRRQRLVL